MSFLSTVPTEQVRLRILLVDAHTDAVAMLGELLRLDGHEVVVAHDGITGLVCIGALRPDVAILDLGLPRLDGCSVAARVRADDRVCHMPLIAVSATADPSDLARTRAAGFDHHLLKPVDWPELSDLLARYTRAAS